MEGYTYFRQNPARSQWKRLGKKRKWTSDEVGNKKIALNEVLEFVTYNCKNSRCKTKKCQCFPLENTDLCNCKSCSNVYTDSDEETAEEDNNYHKFDDGDHWDDIIDDKDDILDNDDIWLGSEFL